MRGGLVIASLAFPLCLNLPFSSQGLDQEAADELARAERHAANGHYSKAVQAYRRIGKQYPGTEAGETVQRRSGPNAFLGWTDLLRSGPSENRVDVVVMGDGWDVGGQIGFDDVAKEVPRVFERDPVFEEYLSYLNVIRANVTSEDGGADGFGREYSTALGGRIVAEKEGPDWIAVDAGQVDQLLAELPAHDGLAITFVKTGGTGSAVEGIVTLGPQTLRPLLRGWGHAFASLMDESTDIGFRGHVRSRINVSDTPDPKEVPWSHWIEHRAKGIGVYEGALGRVKGAWRPTSAGCLMSGDKEFYCPVCREALVLRIYDFVDPIESCAPDPHLAKSPPYDVLSGPGPYEFEVTVMRPAEHALEVSWWVLPENRVPAPDRPNTDLQGIRPRRLRGLLPPIEERPVQRDRARSGVHKFRLRSSGLDPGRYRVVCRARDTTGTRGKKRLWVLKDELGVLESERGWWVDVQ